MEREVDKCRQKKLLNLNKRENYYIWNRYVSIKGELDRFKDDSFGNIYEKTFKLLNVKWIVQYY